LNKSKGCPVIIVVYRHMHLGSQKSIAVHPKLN